ncbi:MAG TPA: hypothetical protein DCL43_07995 [Chitinophagaceae bacterium]|nr:hypothetical protein [Chitinophagaceae bacterium]HAN38043.1 hypothetical protein [Chitinophagaceae bacterium]
MIQKTIFKTKDYCKVKFVVEAPNADSIEVLGLNNNWEAPISLSKKKDGSFAAEVQLPKNTTHEFKYRVNTESWMNEPEADGEAVNIYGGTNSVLVL